MSSTPAERLLISKRIWSYLLLSFSVNNTNLSSMAQSGKLKSLPSTKMIVVVRSFRFFAVVMRFSPHFYEWKNVDLSSVNDFLLSLLLDAKQQHIQGFRSVFFAFFSPWSSSCFYYFLYCDNSYVGICAYVCLSVCQSFRPSV